jgi:hypothetical protein
VTPIEVQKARVLFSQNLIRAMNRMDMTPKDIEEKSIELVIQKKIVRGIYRENIYGYRNAKNLPTVDTLVALAMILEVEPNDLAPPAVVPKRVGRRVIGAASKIPKITVQHVGRVEEGVAQVQITAVLPVDASTKFAETLRGVFEKQGTAVDYRALMLARQRIKD